VAGATGAGGGTVGDSVSIAIVGSLSPNKCPQQASFITLWLIELQPLNIPVAMNYELQTGGGYGIVNGWDVP
jgi:hypothetical protein